MEVETQWDDENLFWEITVSGEIFYDDCLEELEEALETTTPDLNMLVLLNIQSSCEWLSSTDIYYLVRLLFEKKHVPFKKLAVSVSHRYDFEKAHFLELCARNRAMNVFAARSPKEAKAWLLG